MRDIKFRAQQFNHGKHGFQYGSHATDNKNYHAIIKESKSDPDAMCNVLINPETLGQFTGLQDINGVDIYEGDVVLWGHVKGYDECVPRKATVEINPDIGFKTFNLGKHNHTFQFGCFAYQCTDEALEIIGNIHENPELLSEQK